MAELAPGTPFAGHRIEAVAGRGGMGVVYRATHLALDRTVALKVIAPTLIEDASTRERFLRESKVAASLDHPNDIPVYYTGAACTREIWESQSSAMSFVARRPIVRRSAAAPRSTSTWSPAAVR